jgi:hypothetical protein
MVSFDCTGCGNKIYADVPTVVCLNCMIVWFVETFKFVGISIATRKLVCEIPR